MLLLHIAQSRIVTEYQRRTLCRLQLVVKEVCCANRLGIVGQTEDGGGRKRDLKIVEPSSHTHTRGQSNNHGAVSF